MWLPIEEKIKSSTMKMAYQLLNKGVPEELSVKTPMNKNGLRIQEYKKFAKKPNWLNKNKLTKSSLWNHVYSYNTLPKSITTQNTPKNSKRLFKSFFVPSKRK